MDVVSALGKNFAPPGPGIWEVESTHMTRPMTSFAGEVFAQSMPRGFAESTERYGILLSHIEMRLVNGFVYSQPVPYGAPPGAKGPPPKPIFWLITRLHPGMRRRIRTSHEAMERKLWREDLRRWDDEVKPATARAHRELQSVSPESLDDKALGAHLDACRTHLGRMIQQHHRFNMPALLPIGDFIAHTQAWTGKPPTDILLVLRGASPISRGAGESELNALAEALASDRESAELLESGASPGEKIAALRDRTGAVGEHARAYLDAVGVRSLGFDVCEPYALELPGVLVRAIRAARNGSTASPAQDDAHTRRVSELRDAVPAAERARFDELLDEARQMYRLRDERGMYSDALAIGLARRAILAAGRRIADAGRIAAPELLVDATYDEMQALLRGERVVTDDVLRERATWRTSHSSADAPPLLGGTSVSPPPPIDWLPPDARRSMRAMGGVLGLLGGTSPATKDGVLRGVPVSPGVYEGIARIVINESDFARIEQGNVLVARTTAAYFNVLLPLLGAIVTDRGGLLSHAAIVSREYGIPGVVGTGEATKKIRDGGRVRVDGARGEIRLLD